MTNNKKNDPFQEREAEKYDNPIPSREFILAILKQNNVPLSRKSLAKLRAAATHTDRDFWML